jgi:AraC family transcriptional regulator of adaptative response/methylated-DNA-[protein]-cysteine methyltransferase
MMQPALSEDRQPMDWRWNVVVTRDRRADGRFVYAVRSTGIYCRPSCPSRRPDPRRVEFFQTPDAAEAHGYRACKRCHPRDSGADPWVEKIRRACVYLANADGHPSLTRLAARLGGSPYHVQRNFKRLVGVTPREFAAACRLSKLRRGLRNGDDVTTALVKAGYGSSSRFYEQAARRLGMSPSRYRKGGEGMSIHYTTVTTPVGRLLIAATDRGVCAVTLGDSDRGLTEALNAEFPGATIVEDRTRLNAPVERILAHLNGRLPRLDLPLDVQATAFQWQVWTALGEIPRGETRSYGQVAAAIGRPGAARAVARACASNPVALVVPCHRVVPERGGAGGYRWGATRKTAILEAEGGKDR